jgi:hypothetical protein
LLVDAFVDTFANSTNPVHNIVIGAAVDDSDYVNDSFIKYRERRAHGVRPKGEGLRVFRRNFKPFGRP